MNRRSLSPTKRLAIFEATNGVCHICGQKIRVGEAWEVEHVIPLALGGADAPSNMAPAHKDCHKIKTPIDVGRIAKAKRQRAAHVGAKIHRGFRKPPGFKFDWKQMRYVREAQ